MEGNREKQKDLCVRVSQICQIQLYLQDERIILLPDQNH